MQQNTGTKGNTQTLGTCGVCGLVYGSPGASRVGSEWIFHGFT